MIVKSLELKNIRSYDDSDSIIQFSLGITLFGGDIYAGKSTLLYAIEFALFGLGEMKGSYLLRNGCLKGGVTLIFEEGKQLYEVHRSLIKKGNTVHQDECYIKGPSGKQFLAPTDLKERVLQILGFNEPVNSRAQSVIYRYAIFTPQEQMREVISKDPDSRLQTLRKAFRIEDYKIASENCCELLSRINKKILYLKAKTEDYGSFKNHLKETTDEIKGSIKSLGELENKESLVEKSKKELELERTKLDMDRERLVKIEDKIPIYSNQIADIERKITDNRQEILKIQEKVSVITSQMADLKKMMSPSKISLEKVVYQKDDLVRRIEKTRTLEQSAVQSGSQVPLLKITLDNLRIHIKEKLDEKILKDKFAKELQSKITRFNQVQRPTDMSLTAIETECSELETNRKDIDNQVSRLDERISNFVSLMENRECPVCERPIDFEDFTDKNSHIRKEQDNLRKLYDSFSGRIDLLQSLKEDLVKFNEMDTERQKLEINLKDTETEIISLIQVIRSQQGGQQKDLEVQIKIAEKEASKEKIIKQKMVTLEEKVEQSTKLIDALKRYQQARIDLKRCAAGKKDVFETLKRLNNIDNKLKEEKRIVGKLLEKAKNEIRPLNSIITKLDLLKLDLTRIENDLKLVRDNVSETRTRLYICEQNKQKLMDTIKSEEKMIETERLLSEHRVGKVLLRRN